MGNFFSDARRRAVALPLRVPRWAGPNGPLFPVPFLALLAVEALCLITPLPYFLLPRWLLWTLQSRHFRHLREALLAIVP